MPDAPNISGSIGITNIGSANRPNADATGVNLHQDAGDIGGYA
jgi:hypothetical protein